MNRNIEYIKAIKDFLLTLPDTTQHAKKVWITLSRDDINLWDKVTFLPRDTYYWLGGFFIITLCALTLLATLYILKKQKKANVKNNFLENKIKEYLEKYNFKNKQDIQLINKYHQDKRTYQSFIIELILSHNAQSKEQYETQEQIKYEAHKTITLPSWIGISMILFVLIPIGIINYQLIFSNGLLFILIFILISLSTKFTRNKMCKVLWFLINIIAQTIGFFLQLIFPSLKDEETSPSQEVDEETMIYYILENPPSYNLSEEDKINLKKLEQYKKDKTPHLISRKKLENYYYVI